MTPQKKKRGRNAKAERGKRRKIGEPITYAPCRVAMPCGLSLTALRPAELTSTSSFPRWLIRKKKKKEGEKKKRKREREKKNHEYASRRPGHDRLPAFRTRLRGPRIVEVILYGEPRTRPLDADAVVPRACSCCNSPAARHRLIGPRYARIATAVASLYLLLLFSRLLPSFPPRERNKCTPTNAKIYHLRYSLSIGYRRNGQRAFSFFVFRKER